MPTVPNYTSFKIAGRDCTADFGFVLTGGYPSALGLPSIRPQLSTVPGRPGQRNLGGFYDARVVEFRGQIWAADFATAQNRLDDFKAWVGIPQNLANRTYTIDGLAGLKLELPTWRANRHLRGLYNGASDVSAIANQNWLAMEAFEFRIAFICHPYFFENCVSSEYTTSGFKEITGLGNAPLNPLIHVFGANTSPARIVHAVHALTCDFKNIDTSGNPNSARDIYNDSDKTLTLTPVLRYRPGKVGQGIGIFGNAHGNAGDTFTVTTMKNGSAPADPNGDRFDRDKGAIAFWFQPEWNSTTGRDRTFFDDDASTNRFQVDFDASTNEIKVTDGTNTAVATLSHAAGDWVHIYIGWDDFTNLPTGANRLTVFVDGSEGTPAGAYVDDTSATNLYFGSDKDGKQQIDGTIDDFTVWNTPQSAANIASLYNSGAGVKGNTVDSANVILYMDIDGTVGAVIDPLFPEGTILTNNADVTDDDFPVASGGDTTFTRGQNIRVFDDIGYILHGWVPDAGGTLSATNVPISSVKATQTSLTDASKVGVFANFDGSEDAVATDVLDLGTNDWAWSMRFRYSGGAGQDHFFSKSVAGENSGRWSGSFNNTSSRFRVSLGTTGVESDDATAAADGNWHHLFVLGDRSGNCYWYLDGGALGSADISAQVASDIQKADPIRWGNVQGLGDGWVGDIRDGVLWQAADLNAGDNGQADAITARDAQRASTTVNGQNPVGQWEFSENTGTNVNDEVSTNDLTLTAATQWTQEASIQGEVEATDTPMVSGNHYLPSRDKQALYIRDDTLSNSSLVFYNTEFGFVWRGNLEFPSTGNGSDKTLFTIWYDPNDYYRVYYDWSTRRFVIEAVASGASYNIASLQQTFDEGDYLEVSGGFKQDAAGTAADPKITIYTDGTITDQSASGSPTVLAGNPTAFHAGFSTDGGVIITEGMNAAVDHLALFVKRPTPEYFVRYYTQAAPIENQNSGVKVDLTLGEGDRFTLDTHAQKYTYFDASANGESDGGTYVSQRFSTLDLDDSNRILLYIPNSAERYEVIYTPTHL